MSYRTSVVVQLTFDETVARVRDGLATQGFGVLTEIDVQATMKTKLDVDMNPYLILGACNPSLAYRALQAEPSLGVLLPCNVVVRSAGSGSTVVEAVNPATLVELTSNSGLLAITDEVTQRLSLVLKSLSEPTTSPQEVSP